MAGWQYGQLVCEEPTTVLGVFRGTQIVFDGGGQRIKFSSVQQALSQLGAAGLELTSQAEDSSTYGWAKMVYTFKRYR